MADALLLDDPDAIVGASGAGKSYTARKKVEQLLEAKRPTVVFDPTGVWYGLQSDAAGTGPGFDVPIFGGPHANVPITPMQGAAIAGIVIDERISAIIDLSTFEEPELRRFALDFLTRLRDRERTNLHLVFDEAEEFAPQTAPDDIGFQLVQKMNWVAKRGRVFGLVPTFITQRPADFAKAVLSQVQTLYFHQLVAPADQAPAIAYLKANADKATLDTVKGSLPGLERGERWIYSPRRQLLERGTTAPIATFDTMGTPAPGESKREPKSLAQLDVSKIRAALAPQTSEPSIPTNPHEAFQVGAAAGEMLIERDRRIVELEEQLAGAQAARESAVRVGHRAHLALLRLGEDALRQVEKLNAELRGDLQLDGANLHLRDADPQDTETLAASPPGLGDEVAADAAGQQPASAAIRGRKALEALATAHPGWLTEPQWALASGFARKGGTWRTYRQQLAAGGLVERVADKWRATAAGLTAAGAVAEPMPPAGPALARFWSGRISGAPKMVEVLIKRWPHFTTHEALAADLGMAASGGTFRTYVGRLRGQELLEEKGKRLRLSPNVMGGDL